MSKMLKKEYTNWLRQKKKENGKPYSNGTVMQYVSALSTSPAKLTGVHLDTTNVFEITDADQYSRIKETIKQADNFDLVNERTGNKAFQYTLAYYEEFLRERESKINAEFSSSQMHESSNSVTARKASLTGAGTHQLVDKNTILYGPPGTGKTYHTVLYAVAIIERLPLNVIIQEVANDGYESIKHRFNRYNKNGQITLTTFHQSYSYEEFIEGIRPVIGSEENISSEAGDVDYEIVPGIFKSFCKAAQEPVVRESNDYGIRKEPTVWKVSLGGSKENSIKRDCFNYNRIRIGWDSYGEIVSEETDYSQHGGKKILSRFINEMRNGDIVLVLYDEETIDAIGVVTGDYEWLEDVATYKRSRNVKWLIKDIRENIMELNGNTVMTLGSVYRLNRISLSDVLAILQRQQTDHVNSVIQENNNNYVFIIDEINRGNISRIFGELITLIESTKRIGTPEEVMLRLPYSKELFGVPEHVYLLATMNTADRSIARLDTALRRRFSFAEMLPDPSTLTPITVNETTLDLPKMLETMNKRIEVLYDREHTIGHAYFLELTKDPTMERLGLLFEHTIIPLLQEYFYDHYEKIRLILGDNNKLESEQFIVQTKVNLNELFGHVEELDLEEHVTYKINHGAFSKLEAYRKIYDYNNLVQVPE